jgi:LEA14-like dessication related protein
MKKNYPLRVVLYSGLGIIGAVSALLAWKASNKKDDFHFRPEVFITGLSIEDSDEKFLKIYPTLNIVNDLPVEARVRELEYELKNGNTVLAKNLQKKNITIQKHDTTQIMLAMQIGKMALDQLMKEAEAENADSATLHLHALFKLDVPVSGYRSFEISKDIDVPLLKLFSIESRKIKVDKFSLKHPKLDMDIRIQNPNNFPIVIDNFKIDLGVGNDLKLHGGADGIQRLPANSAETISVNMDVDDLNAIKLVWKSIFKDEKTPFKSKLSFKVISKNKSIDGSQVVILKDGTLNEIKSP